MADEMVLRVTGMTCGGCENAVKRVLSMVDGVSSATASHKDKEVRVVYDPAKVDRSKIARAIETAGYQVGA
jgi:copper chaperone CopZ